MSEQKETFKEIANTEHTVILEGSNGTTIVWNFMYDPPTSTYYADQSINGRQGRFKRLAKDRVEAQRLWNSTIRHKKRV